MPLKNGDLCTRCISQGTNYHKSNFKSFIFIILTLSSISDWRIDFFDFFKFFFSFLTKVKKKKKTIFKSIVNKFKTYSVSMCLNPYHRYLFYSRLRQHAYQAGNILNPYHRCLFYSRLRQAGNILKQTKIKSLKRHSHSLNSQDLSSNKYISMIDLPQ